MLEKHTKDLETLVEWYNRTKNFAIEVESFETKSYIQPLHELRYSFDHLMHAIYYELDAEDGSDGKVKSAILAAQGHLIRSYGDCLEWMLLITKGEFERILQVDKRIFTFEEIKEYISDYEAIRENIQKINDAVDEYKQNKPSEEDCDFDASKELNNSLISTLRGADGFFDEKYARQLKEYYIKIRKREADFENLKNQKKRKSIYKEFILPTLTAVISGLVVYGMTCLF